MSWRARARADLRDASTLALTELRVRWRALAGNLRRLVAVGFVLVVFAVFVPAAAWGPATDLGRQLASGSVPLGSVGAALATAAAAGLYVGGSSGFEQESGGRVGPLVRTSMPPRAVSIGRLAGEVGQVIPVVALVGAVLSVAVALGAGGPQPAALLGFGAVPPFLVGVCAGRLLGSGLRYVNRALRVSLWTKALLFLGASVAVYAATYALVFSSLDGNPAGNALLTGFLPGRPLQAYGSVLLQSLGTTPRPLGWLVTAGWLPVVGGGLVAALAVETRLLVRDSAPDESADASVGSSRGVPRPFALTAAGRVAWRHLLRTRRDPRTLAHLGPLLFGLLGMGASVLREPQSVGSIGPPAAVLSGAILAGAAYCLNPLGDDREQLPLLLTSTHSVAVLLRGRALAGLAFGLALGVTLGVPATILRGHLGLALLEAGMGVVLALSAAGTALGIGALVPRFERREYMSIERAHPSLVVMLAFMTGAVLVGGVGLGLLWWTRTVATVGPAALAWIAYLGSLAALGGGGYAYAVRRFDALTLDEV